MLQIFLPLLFYEDLILWGICFCNPNANETCLKHVGKSPFLVLLYYWVPNRIWDNFEFEETERSRRIVYLSFVFSDSNCRAKESPANARSRGPRQSQILAYVWFFALTISMWYVNMWIEPEILRITADTATCVSPRKTNVCLWNVPFVLQPNSSISLFYSLTLIPTAAILFYSFGSQPLICQRTQLLLRACKTNTVTALQ